MTCNAEKKNLTPLHVGEKFLIPEVWEKILTQTKGRAIIFLTWERGGGGGELEIFTRKHLFTCGSCCKQVVGVSVFLQTLFFACIPFISVFTAYFKIFHPPPLPFKKVIFRP